MPAFWRPNFMNRGAAQPLFVQAGNRPSAEIAVAAVNVPDAAVAALDLRLAYSH